MPVCRRGTSVPWRILPMCFWMPAMSEFRQVGKSWIAPYWLPLASPTKGIDVCWVCRSNSRRRKCIGARKCPNWQHGQKKTCPWDLPCLTTHHHIVCGCARPTGWNASTANSSVEPAWLRFPPTRAPACASCPPCWQNAMMSG